MPEYLNRLLKAFVSQDANDEEQGCREHSAGRLSDTLIEPLSDREFEILRLIAQGLSNQDISERLYLALSTVKGHNRNIFDKLQVKRRTEAVAHARKLGLL
ncbi:response regulator transcription factor [Paenibacillus chibensis]|nr:response regulator transcription factor [Paenibacillus chibensis]